jgi:hypothetical protein
MAHYRIYFLILWQENHREPDRDAVLRFTLEDPRTGKRQHFADADSLFTALQSGLVDSGSQPSDTEEISP